MILSEVDINKLYLLKSKSTENIYLKINNYITRNALNLYDMDINTLFLDRELDIIGSLYDTFIGTNKLSYYKIFGTILNSERLIMKRYVDQKIEYFLKINDSPNNANILTIFPTLKLDFFNPYKKTTVIGSLNDLEIEI